MSPQLLPIALQNRTTAARPEGPTDPAGALNRACHDIGRSGEQVLLSAVAQVAREQWSQGASGLVGPVTGHYHMCFSFSCGKSPVIGRTELWFHFAVDKTWGWGP